MPHKTSAAKVSKSSERFGILFPSEEDTSSPRSPCAQNVYIHSSSHGGTYYLVPSRRLLRVCGRGRSNKELDKVIAQFIRKIESCDKNSWESWSEFAYWYKQIRIVKKVDDTSPFVCSCEDGKFVFCRHALALALLEGCEKYAPLAAVKVAGAVPKGRPAYTSAPALLTDSAYVRRHLNLPGELDIGAISSGQQEPFLPNGARRVSVAQLQSDCDRISVDTLLGDTSDGESSGDEDDPQRIREKTLIESVEEEDEEDEDVQRTLIEDSPILDKSAAEQAQRAGREGIISGNSAGNLALGSASPSPIRQLKNPGTPGYTAVQVAEFDWSPEQSQVDAAHVAIGNVREPSYPADILDASAIGAAAVAFVDYVRERKPNTMVHEQMQAYTETPEHPLPQHPLAVNPAILGLSLGAVRNSSEQPVPASAVVRSSAQETHPAVFEPTMGNRVNQDVAQAAMGNIGEPSHPVDEEPTLAGEDREGGSATGDSAG
ncbi:hypothetical protein FOZ60_004020 [Perkinsus olseni]|uniref:SWIM-type domain-containing protein n=1 Tax=Perkinsus olseni TaxID=32597 RepID=A0A7J6NUB5_PEROL|nr:hypothetical protein FOZ60_004020 [Perkinsus olseni]